MKCEKVISGVVPKATENTRVIAAFLPELMERGLRIAEGLLVVIDGCKGLRGDGTLHVPKRDMIGALVLALERRRLRIAGALPLVSVLLQELATFQVRITQAAQDTYGAWREGAHDDLVLAVALAVWYALFGASTEFLRKAYGW